MSHAFSIISNDPDIVCGLATAIVRNVVKHYDSFPHSLYGALIDAKVEIANHESDLYFPVTAQTTEILSRFPLEKGNATMFRNQRDQKRAWYDVPFAYIPWWEKRTGNGTGPPRG